MNYKRHTPLLLPLILFMTGCSTIVPKEAHHNACSIYDFNDDWQDAAEASAKKWGTPPHILLAFVKQESGFRPQAKPPKEYYLGFIPYQRSSAYGYSQAQDPVWEEYLKDTGRSSLFASRENIHDALDFMGWYNYQSHKRNNISRYNAYDLYLAYHEGNGGFKTKSYLKKPWLVKVAQKVKKQSNIYKKQLSNCADNMTAEASVDNIPKAKTQPKSKTSNNNTYRNINTGKAEPCNAPWPYCR